MRIITRDGTVESLDLNKIFKRLEKAREYCGDKISKDVIDIDVIALKVINTIRDNITTEELDEITAQICMNLSLEHPDWAVLGSGVIVSNHQKKIQWSFSDGIEMLYQNTDKKGRPAPLVSKELHEIVQKNVSLWNSLIKTERDFNLDFFGFKTLERSYLLKLSDGKFIETPQYMFLRVAIGIWGTQTNKVINTYNLLSTFMATHATPTLFNAGTKNPALSSCFLLGTEDSIQGIYKTISDCASISKWSGGIGVHLSNVRSNGSYIRGTGGVTQGIVPMMKVYNDTARYVNQCFVPETIIYTSRGPLEIQNIQKGDHVITNDGSFRRVNEVFVNLVNKKIRKITTMNGNDPLRCTDVHQIQVVRFETSQRQNDFSEVLEGLQNGTLQREFIDAKDIKKGYMMCYPIPKYNATNKVSFSEYEVIVDNFRNFGTLMEKLIYAPLEVVKDVIELIFEDHIRDLGREMPTLQQYQGSPKVIYTLNRKAYEITRFLFLRMGQLTAGRVLSDGAAYEIIIPKNKFFQEFISSDIQDFNGFFEYDGYLYTPVLSNEEVEYKGKVFDLNVEDNHNYLTSSGLVHNSGKRLGSFAMYLEPWHGDIFRFLRAMRKHGDEETLAKDLYYALWIPDLFMEKVKNKEDWYLMCPDECPGLNESYGKDFDKLYNKYIEEGLYKEKVSAIDLWNEILKSQIESGMPYMLYKDAANQKSNQSNLGTIKSSNLCVAPETMVLTDKGYYKISELENKEVNVWNGEEWSKTIVRKTGENQKLIKITFSNGSVIECTPYHKFAIETAGKLDAAQLKKDMKIAKFKLPDNNEISNILITDIIDENRYDDTFCFTEPKKGMGVFNGILTYNCAEILEYSNNKETAVCNLASIRLQSHIIKTKKDTTGLDIYTKPDCNWCKLLVIFLDTQDIAYNLIYIDDPNEQKEFIEKSDMKTFPQTYQHEKLIGGFDATVEHFRPEIDWNNLQETVHTLVENIDRVIDINYYPTPESKYSNLTHRPMGIGVQGLADMFAEMWIPFESQKAKEVNRLVFEGIYYFALEKSHQLAKTKGAYHTFPGSPLSRGKFQFDLWNVQPSQMWDWEILRANIQKDGVRNSLLIALMPTASTAQIMGSTESFEPFNSCMYLRRTLSGEFLVVNKYLMHILNKLNIWDNEMKQRVMFHRGSIQNISQIPQFVKDCYKTVWEIKKKHLIEMSADRGAFVCQSQSFNIYVESTDPQILTNIHFYGWSKGLKTGSYYTRSRPAVNPQSFTIDPLLEEKFKNENKQEEECLMCSA